jgi:hypothetical protein
MSKDKYALYGASGHCKVIIDLIKLNNGEVNYIIDDDSSKKFFEGIEIMSPDFLDQINHELIVSIGNNLTRKKIVESTNK